MNPRVLGGSSDFNSELLMCSQKCVMCVTEPITPDIRRDC